MLFEIALNSTNINGRLDFFFAHRLDHELGEIPCLHGFFPLIVLDAVGNHGKTERTTYGNRIGIDGDCLFGAGVVNALSDIFFHPHSRTACAAAEALVKISFHLDNIDATDRLENLAGLIINMVVAAQEARIVIDKCPLERFGQLDFAGRNQVGDNLCVMIDFEIAAEIGVIFFNAL